jgi:hypothetical protein
MKYNAQSQEQITKTSGFEKKSSSIKNSDREP